MEEIEASGPNDGIFDHLQEQCGMGMHNLTSTSQMLTQEFEKGQSFLKSVWDVKTLIQKTAEHSQLDKERYQFVEEHCNSLEPSQFEALVLQAQKHPQADDYTKFAKQQYMFEEDYVFCSEEGDPLEDIKDFVLWAAQAAKAKATTPAAPPNKTNS